VLHRGLRSAVCFFTLLALAAAPAVQAATVRDVRTKMGSPFEVTAVLENEELARQAVDKVYAEVDRIEALISEWRGDSEVSAINAAAGDHAVAVSPEVFELIRRSIKVSELTEGAFDITWLSVGKLWDMKAAHPARPSPAAIEAALADTGSRHIALDSSARTVFLRAKGTQIGFGGIGKGYAANRGVAVLRELGARGGIVSAGGDMMAFGVREDGEPWRIGIADPFQPDKVFGYVRLANQAIVTSGDYERFVVIDGHRYSHIIDPRTGYPAEELRSVTIICPDAELADALATGVTVLGRERGMALVNRLKNVHALLVDRDGRVHVSRHLQSLIEETKP
jgi:thiamine biosynthesis lipoprotein